MSPSEDNGATLFPCHYLQVEVECTAEREQHIRERHPDLLARGPELIATTLADTDQVRRSARFGNARLVSRWYDDLGKHVVVVVVSHPNQRHWIITAYIASRLAEGETEWKRS